MVGRDYARISQHVAMHDIFLSIRTTNTAHDISPSIGKPTHKKDGGISSREKEVQVYVEVATSSTHWASVDNPNVRINPIQWQHNPCGYTNMYSLHVCARLWQHMRPYVGDVVWFVNACTLQTVSIMDLLLKVTLPFRLLDNHPRVNLTWPTNML